jgi:hypothetical protein
MGVIVTSLEEFTDYVRAYPLHEDWGYTADEWLGEWEAERARDPQFPCFVVIAPERIHYYEFAEMLGALTSSQRITDLLRDLVLQMMRAEHALQRRTRDGGA